ncbi:MAG: AtpZ/AtpI family protein [Phycisphaerales bacterium]|nr:AtpZ/AtpI family protein [Phycisphaerales bacterium]
MTETPRMPEELRRHDRPVASRSGGGSHVPSAADAAYSSQMWAMASMGFTLASEILAGTGLGWLVDYLGGTRPWGIIIGTIIGLAVGMTTFIRSALRQSGEAGADAKRRAPAIPARPEGWDDEDADDDDRFGGSAGEKRHD